MLGDSVKARLLANEILSDTGLDTINKMCSALNARMPQLKTVDHLFDQLEGAWAKNVDACLIEAAEKNIAKCLPSKDDVFSTTTSLAKLAELMHSAQFVKGGSGPRGILTSVQEVVLGIVRGVSPDFNWSAGSPFFADILTACSYFLVEKLTQPGKNDKILYGKSAFLSKLETLRATIQSAPTAQALKELEALRPFFWLVDAQAQNTVNIGIK